MGAGSIVSQGEMDSVVAVARRLSRLDELRETVSWLRVGVEHLQTAGEAQALTALLAACRPLEARAQQIAQARDSAGAALRRYAEQATSMQQEAHVLQARRRSVEDDRARLAYLLANADAPADAWDAEMRVRWLNAQLDDADASLGIIEQQLHELDMLRLRADTVCANAIGACTAELNSPGLAPASSGDIRTARVSQAGFSPADLLRVALMRPDRVAQWWGSLSVAERNQLKTQHSLFIGNLDGVPIDDRVLANAQTAEGYVDDGDIDDEERAYWQRVIDGTVKLVVLDRDNGRIVEMLGEIGPDTRQVVTYVPGTTTRLRDFISGEVRRGPRYLSSRLPGSVVFVYKDFPAIGWLNNLDEEGLADRGRRLAGFDLAISTDPRLAGLPQSAIGYSAGMPVVAGSETYGARYDRVISLGGSYVPDDWHPQPDTKYTDVRYEGDFLNNLDERPYFEGLHTINGQPEVFEPIRPKSPDPGENRGDQHGRLGQGPNENKPVLDELVEIILEDNR